jgi:Sortase and related acyltransferases
MKREVIIRDIAYSDLEQVNKILNNIIENHTYNVSHYPKTLSYTQKWFDDHSNSDKYKIFVAECEGMFAGWVSLSPFRSSEGYDTTAELSVYINPPYYRHGIGTLLMKHIEAYAKSSGLLHCIISVITADNITSIDLHQKLGYKVNGIFKELAKKNDSYVDIVMMTKLLK